MQQFTVPQFIEVEPKIIGPITARQFIMFLVAAFLIFIAYKTLNFGPFVFVAVLIFGITGVFAFLKVNGRPFHFFLLNMLQSFKKPSIRVWDHKGSTLENKEDMDVKYEKVLTQEKYLNQAKLAKVSLVVDTKGRYKGEDGDSLLYEEVDF
ncbi:MAG: PrgI family protein [Patescibacteria group bacterium]